MSAEPADLAEILRLAFGQSVTGIPAHTLTFSAKLRDDLTPALRRVARKMRRFGFVLHFAEMRANDTRPNGRPRRSGHRHRGTTAWQRRYATRR